MDMTSLIISLVSGAVGGNAAGKVLKNFDMGTLWNSVAGIVGGGLGGERRAAGLLGEEAEVVRIAEHLLEDQPGGVESLRIGASGPRHRLGQWGRLRRSSSAQP